MAKINLDRQRCKGCLLCLSVCPKGLLIVDKDLNRKGVRPAKSKASGECSGCMQCAIICPECCIEVYR